MPNNNIPIIYYHSVAPGLNQHWQKKYLTHELRYFEEHLKYFKQNGFRSLFLNEFFEIPPGKKKHFLLTFDDGYLDNYIYVYPLLKKYGFKGTIFVSPDFVDTRHGVRPTMEDYWDNKKSMAEIDQWGFLNWEEMRIMEKSGHIDIQSHTMTHTKYFASDKIVSIHHPGGACLNPIGNIFPEEKPYYIANDLFEKKLPYGAPFFEEKSSVITRRVLINPDFNQRIIDTFKDYNWDNDIDAIQALKTIEPIFQRYKANGEIIQSIESETEYRERVRFELVESKKIIESNLNKTVNYCCWPHGDNNEISQQIAKEAGYLATSVGKANVSADTNDRFDRLGLGYYRFSKNLTRLKTMYKIQSKRKIQPFHGLNKLYNLVRYGNKI